MKNSRLIRVVSSLAVVALLFGGSLTPPANATTNSEADSASITHCTENCTVTRVGQWVGESGVKQDEEKVYANTEEVLGDPLPNPGLYRGAAKIFLGWSDKETVGNGEIAPGARFFSKSDKLATVFPAGVPAGAKIYGVYFSLNAPGEPFPSNNLGMGLAFLTMASMLRTMVNQNTATINTTVTGEDTLVHTSLLSDTEENNVRTVLDKHELKNDTDSVNEIKLNAEFNMNDTIAMLVYKNPTAGYGWPNNTILSRDYATRYDTGDFGDADGAAAGYTYVDLKVNLGEKVNIPERLYLEFKGYAWRPLYVYGQNKKRLTIVNPENDTALGNDKTAFRGLVNNDDPRVLFGIETQGSKEITVRVVLRHGENEQIPEATIVPNENGTIAEKIVENMTLRAIDSSILQIVRSDLSATEVNERVLTIKHRTAQELALSCGVDTADITGSVVGNAQMSVGTLSFFNTNSSVPVTEVTANTLKLGYKCLNKVSFDKNSVALGDSAIQQLGEAVVLSVDALQTEDLTASLAGDGYADAVLPVYHENPDLRIIGGKVVAAPTSFTVEENGVEKKYVFQGWNTQADGNGAVFTDNTEVTENVTVYAQWAQEIPAPAVPVLETASQCGIESTVVIPQVEHVTYEQNKVESTVTVTASANDGYVFVPDAVTTWTFEVGAQECPPPVEPEKPVKPELTPTPTPEEPTPPTPTTTPEVNTDSNPVDKPTVKPTVIPKHNKLANTGVALGGLLGLTAIALLAGLGLRTLRTKQ